MSFIYDPHASNRSVSVRVNGHLPNKARALNSDLSAALEAALIEAFRDKQREQWLAENRQAIAAYNLHMESNGVFSDDLRSF